MSGVRGMSFGVAAAFCCLMPHLAPGLVQAAAVGAPNAANAASLTEADLGPRNYTQRGANTIRKGSLLRAEGAEVKAVGLDLQSDLGRRRDAAVRTHYSRLAELDYIAELAVKSRNVALAERLETTRRKEVERFFGIMQAIRAAAVPQASEAR